MKDSTELPQLLQDRNLKSNTNKAAGFLKDIKAKTADAMDMAGDRLSDDSNVVLNAHKPPGK